MDFSIRRVRALFKKEVKDLRKNKNVMLMCFLPIVLCLIYTQVIGTDPKTGMGKEEILTFSLNMNLTMVSCFIISMLIAEEKEKNTLRTLMMSSVSSAEFLVGKAVVSMVISIITDIIMFFMTGMKVDYLAVYILMTFIVTIGMLELGAVIGLIAENQMATGVIGSPVLMLMLMIPLFSSLNSTWKSIASFLPNYSLNQILEKVFKGKSMFTGNAQSFVVIFAWIVGGAVLFALVYRKKGLDR